MQARGVLGRGASVQFLPFTSKAGHVVTEPTLVLPREALSRLQARAILAQNTAAGGQKEESEAAEVPPAAAAAAAEGKEVGAACGGRKRALESSDALCDER